MADLVEALIGAEDEDDDDQIADDDDAELEVSSYFVVLVSGQEITVHDVSYTVVDDNDIVYFMDEEAHSLLFCPLERLCYAQRITPEEEHGDATG